MEKTESIKELTLALSKVQGALRAVKEEALNPFYHSHYADLAMCWEACRKPLSDNGLAVIQVVDEDKISGKLYLETILAHTSGEWIKGVYFINPLKSDPQSIGSAITYARRYALCAMLGITAKGEDDDAERATGRADAGDEKGKTTSPSPDLVGTPSKEHWCAKHNTAFFMRGKMRSYAHPIGEGKEWCYEHKEPQKEQEIKEKSSLASTPSTPDTSKSSPVIPTTGDNLPKGAFEPLKQRQKRDVSAITTITALYKACHEDFGLQPKQLMAELNIDNWTQLTLTPTEAYQQIAKRLGGD